MDDRIDAESDGTDLHNPASSYALLLQSLQKSAREENHRTKRRRVTGGESLVNPGRIGLIATAVQSAVDISKLRESKAEEELSEIEDKADEEGNQESDAEYEDGKLADVADHFHSHFVQPTKALIESIPLARHRKWHTHKYKSGEGNGTNVEIFTASDESVSIPSKLPDITINDMKLKKKLLRSGEEVLQHLHGESQAMLPYVFGYQDVLFTLSSVDNVASTRKMLGLHILNHIFKTRDTIIKNSARVSAAKNDEVDVDCRDQGYTRPKVLVVLETRQACYKFLMILSALANVDQEENKKRLRDDFYLPEDKFGEDKAADFRELFEGNADNDFRIGVKFTRKSIKYFSRFYSADIILGSPLGLRRVMNPEK